MTDPSTWIDCPVCDDSYDTQEEADACKEWHFTEGGMARLPGGGWCAWEDLTEEEYEAAEALEAAMKAM